MGWTIKGESAALGRVLMLSVSCVAFCSACAVGPDYVPPDLQPPAAYKEEDPVWRQAHVPTQFDAGAWWKIYQNADLDRLMPMLDAANTSILSAEAAVRQARAVVDESEASLFPSLSLNGDRSRSGTGAARTKTSTQYDLKAGASWELDVWGRLRRTVEGDEASAASAQADLAAARLSAEAQLVKDYFSLCAADDATDLARGTVDTYQKSYDIAVAKFKAGSVSNADVAEAETQVQQARADLIHSDLTRAQLEHAVAVLLGKAPADFSQPKCSLTRETQVPIVPSEVPSALLVRRPDIVAAEREAAAAHAQIGVAVAAYYPNVTLSGSYGYAGSALGKLAQASQSVWAWGPAVAATVFDAGARGARLDQAKAGFDAKVASYRQTVLTAFLQVEDALVAQRVLSEEAKATELAVSAARLSEARMLRQYQIGSVPFSSLATVQVAALTNEKNALSLRRDRLLASVALIEALGGGWSAPMSVNAGE